MTAFTLYRSSDSNAPVYTGEVGTLVNVLDKCLVAGYGAKAAAGWTKPFTGTNKAAFRQGTGSNQFYLRVDDAGPGAGAAKEARVRAYESMSDVDTGVNPFPTVAQATNGWFVRKSVTADATARPWILVADARTFYMFALTGDSANVYLGWSFGEFYSLKTSDAGRCQLIARGTENSGTISQDLLDRFVGGVGTANGITSAPNAIPRDYQGTVSPQVGTAIGKQGDLGTNNTFLTMVGTLTFTNPPDNRIYCAPIRILESTGGTTGHIRGEMRGFWHWCHPLLAVSDGDTFDGSGDNAGKTFLVIKQSGNGGIYIIETSDTLRSN